MKHLYLLRHAKSSWDDPALADTERPLAARGRRDVKRIAAYAGGGSIAPDLVLCSPARRTRETLKGIAGALGPRARVRIEPRLYGAGRDELLGVLRRVSAGVESVMLIGHNPGLQDLAVLLSGAGPLRARVDVKFPTGALATLDAPVADWAELGAGVAELVDFAAPRDLRG